MFRATVYLLCCLGGVVVARAANHDQAPALYLEQNWSEAERQEFYNLPQGSHLMPYEWAMQLRNPNNSAPFFTGTGLARFGYIPQAPSPLNPDGLPIGFTKDEFRRRNFLGMNCAACHTSNIQAGSTTLRIDGGAALADFQSFVNAMDAASRTTLENPVLFENFARGVLGDRYSLVEKERLRVEFANYLQERREWQVRNSSELAWGPARNDAFGVIFNQVLAASLDVPANRREPNAPVSYPVLWDTNQHDLVQWVGIASNAEDKGGALSRNIGQVLGVFGQVDLSRRTLGLNGFCSSARRRNLEKLESHSKTLWSPRWPQAILGELNETRLARGREIYQNRCVQCHAEIRRDDPNRQVEARMIPVARVGTDPKAAENAARRTALTGTLMGGQLELVAGRAMDAEEPAALVLKHVVAGSMAGTISPLTCRGDLDTAEATILLGWKRVFGRAIGKLFTASETEPSATLAERMAAQITVTERYKARPLNGIWSSAPYLHNGSVKNLYELLLPASERSRIFRVGCNKFDAENVGFACEDDTQAFALDTSLPGNSNAGHEFAASLSDSDRRALLEYLKSL